MRLENSKLSNLTDQQYLRARLIIIEVPSTHHLDRLFPDGPATRVAMANTGMPSAHCSGTSPKPNGSPSAAPPPAPHVPRNAPTSCSGPDGRAPLPNPSVGTPFAPGAYLRRLADIRQTETTI